MKTFKMYASFVLLYAASIFMVAAVEAQQTVTIRVASDSSSGTYSKMLGEVVNACGSDEFNIQTAKNSGGAVGNLDALYNNQADAAFMHSDVFAANAQADPSYNRFKTLVALWPEPIHVLTLRVSKTKKQGTLSWGTVEINSLQDTAGFSVGAAGGGVITGRVLSIPGHFNVVDEGTGANVIAALDRGDVAAAIFVGAAPLPNFQGLDKNKYRIVPIGENIANSVSNFYRPAKINYPGLTNGPLTTLAPVATLITKVFQTPEKVNAQRALRSCFTRNLAQLQDNGSPNWQLVNANDPGTLNNYLELPATATTNRRK